MRSLAAAAVAFALAAAANAGPAGAQATPPAPAPSASPPPAASAPAVPEPAPEPSPVVTATPAPLPVTPAPSPAPSPVPTATTSPSPFHYVIDPPPPAAGSPGILEIAVNDRVLHPGGPYIVRVTTTADVTGVQVQAMGGGYALPPAGPGRFFTSGSVPSEIPFFLLDRSYTLTVIASTADGRLVSIQVPMRLER